MNVLGLATFFGLLAFAVAGLDVCNVRGHNEKKLILTENFRHKWQWNAPQQLLFPVAGAFMTMGEISDQNGDCYMKVMAKVDEEVGDNHITGMSVVIGDKDCKYVVDANFQESGYRIQATVNGEDANAEPDRRSKSFSNGCGDFKVKLYWYGDADKPSLTVRGLAGCPRAEAKLTYQYNSVRLRIAENEYKINGPCDKQYQT